MRHRHRVIDSPIGPLVLVGDGTVVCELRLPRPDATPDLGPADGPHDPNAFGRAVAELDEYFAGRRRSFTVPVAPAGTPFRRRVWAALRTIPHGATATYGQIAHRLGAPGAARAVGQACGANPVAVIVPCHRVVGRGGSLVGFGGGLEAKAWLLAHEARSSAVVPTPAPTGPPVLAAGAGASG